MALDAYEGEQRLNHTASNWEHVWRLLQGGELIAPVPPLPPRETPDPQPETVTMNTTQPGAKTEDGPSAPEPHNEAVPPPPVKKTRTRKKAETAPEDPAELGSVVQAEEGVTPPTPSPKRSRKKKVTDEAGSRVETGVKTSSESSDSSALQVSAESDAVSAPGKPRRTRSAGEPNRSVIQPERKILSKGCSIAPGISERGMVDQDGPGAHREGECLTMAGNKFILTCGHRSLSGHPVPELAVAASALVQTARF